MAAILLRYFVDDFMRNINCGIWVLHVKRVVDFSARSSFYCFS